MNPHGALAASGKILGGAVCCYLETSDRANVASYNRFGFSVVADDLVLVPR